MKKFLFLIIAVVVFAKESLVVEEKITLGGGCFWCLEAIYQEVEGVKSVVSGYMGGDKKSANYPAVSTGLTKHAEVVQIIFDPDKINLLEILNIFWNIHDPTSLDRQGADIGPQYRSIIFTSTNEQLQKASESLLEAQDRFSLPIVTQVVPQMEFFEAEEYHQNYFKNNPNNAYCQAVIAPKVKKFKEL